MAQVQIPVDSPFGLANLPYGVFAPAGGPPRAGVRVGDQVLDLAAALGDPVFAGPALNPFLAQGPARWREVRQRLTSLLAGQSGPPQAALHPLAEVSLLLPVEVGDYVDFYASEHHASNLGQLFRPGAEPLLPNWKHLPVGYHGRSGTVVVSGTPVVRPRGQRKAPADDRPTYGPSRRLDIEAEVGFVVGTGSKLGQQVTLGEFAGHVFGVCLVNDWSARDLQAWEYLPLGPFLGKSFATSVSPWIVPLASLEHARIAPPRRDTPLLPYLADDGAGPWGLNLTLQVRLNGHLVASPPYATMYWTPAQMLAHMTVNGASVRPGDLFASGTVSGPRADQRGSLIELSWGGHDVLTLPDGTTRTFLEDGDEVTISASAPGPNGARIGFGEVTGRILPAHG
ncbi:MAG: fumarylacetoacetase [Streptosporangiaceae bacterium]|nr:fumarylacetoacetase [Streptosporangiaceae bacterium]